MDKYTATIFYTTTHETYNHTKRDAFETSQKALEWASREMAMIMVHWYEIDGNGVTITARITNENYGFDEKARMENVL